MQKVNPIQFVPMKPTSQDDFNVIIMGHTVGTFRWERNQGGNPSFKTGVVRSTCGGIGVASNESEAIGILIKMHSRLDPQPGWVNLLKDLIKEKS